jgi:hypothetical protein
MTVFVKTTMTGRTMAQVVSRGLSPRRPGFAPGSNHVGLLVDKVAPGQVFLRVLRFFPVNITPPSLVVWGMRNMLT